MIHFTMKLAGLLLLLAGWAIVLSALMLLRPSLGQNSFIVAGLAIEALGLALAARAHRPLLKEGE